jgi:phage terminase large subunit GpA-like protein
VSKLTPSEIRDKSALSTAVGGIVPAWAVALIISVDTQKDHFWYVVRAWGTNWRSQLVRQERAGTFTELYNLFSTPFATDNGGQVLPQVMVIDTGGTGNRTQEVYDFAASDAARIIPIKGNSHKGHAGYTLGKQASGLPLYLLNTDYYKDRLQALIKDPDTTKWGVYRDVGENYCLQMASETQIVNRQTGKYEWVEINSGGQNHIWDCEVYSVAAYDIGRFALMPAVPIAPPPPSLPQQLQNTLQPVTSGNPWLGTKGSWL